MRLCGVSLEGQPFPAVAQSRLLCNKCNASGWANLMQCWLTPTHPTPLPQEEMPLRPSQTWDTANLRVICRRNTTLETLRVVHVVATAHA